MDRVPADIFVVANAATPATNAFDPSVAVPFLNVTFPVGVPVVDFTVTVSVTVVVCVSPPPVPVTVMLRVPARARRLTRMLIVELPDPGAAIELGLKLMVTLLPPPEANKLIPELNPPDMAVVIVELPVFPGDTLIDAGDALMVKLGGFVPVTVRATVVCATVLPDVPVTVIV